MVTDASPASIVVTASGDTVCPPATQDIAINLENRKKAIDTAMYGPLNPAEPNEEYWEALGDEWNVDVETAKKQRCGNCAVFIQTPEMKACIENGLTDNNDEFESIDAKGDLGYCEIFDFKCASARTCRAWVAGGPVTAAGSKPAPKKDRIKGSDKNPKGSASGGKKITFSAKTEETLREKVAKHNEKAPEGRKATLGMLKAVYRRGAGAYSSSHRPGMTRDGWAYARVNAFLRLLKSGRPANANYKQDNDLLPSAHPKASNSIIASANYEDELTIEIKKEYEYESPEHAIFALAELSGQGYEMIPALRAAWLRGIRDNESPFARATVLASALHDSKDADLLPKNI